MSAPDGLADAAITVRTSRKRREAVDEIARIEGKTRAALCRDLMNEGWRRRYELEPVVPTYGPTDWQPIETAPKDGAPLILAPHMMIGWWEFGDEEWLFVNIPLNEDQTIQADWSKPIKMFYCLYANVAGVEPTHWLPCPMPPASGVSAGSAETQGGSGLQPASPTAESGDARD